jgi:hypothetical protein
MVAHINGTADQLSALRVRTGNNQVLGSHHIPLEPGCDESVDVFTHGDKNLASKVTALLSAMQLVFKVNGCGTVLSEKLS